MLTVSLSISTLGTSRVDRLYIYEGPLILGDTDGFFLL